MLKFFIPILYTIGTRYERNIKGVLLFLAVYLVPQLIIMCYFAQCEMLWWIFAIVVVLNLYEIGYIQNDAETIKKEINPTLRLSSGELKYYENNKAQIYGWRLFCGFVISYLFFIRGCSYVALFVLWFILPIYFLYNNLRNKWNFLILTILTFYRYLVPVLLCITESLSIWAYIYIYMSYPFPAILQQSVMGKFGIKIGVVEKYILPNYSNRYVFRIKYYFLLSILVLLSCVLYQISLIFVLLPMYYLAIRVALYLLKKEGIQS